MINHGNKLPIIPDYTMQCCCLKNLYTIFEVPVLSNRKLCKHMLRLLWQQGDMATSYTMNWQQIVQLMAVASKDLCIKYEVPILSNSKVTWHCFCPRDLRTKNEFSIPSNSNLISTCFCCHGNKVSKATS